MDYSITQLQSLAKNNQQELINIINSNNINISTLTMAVEILGEKISDEILVLPIFKRLLKHIHADVRESTILAILSFYSNNKVIPIDIFNKLKIIVKSDPSPNVRDCCCDLLNTLK